MSNSTNNPLAQLDMPFVQVPAISTMRNGSSLYVQMNLQSWVVVSSKVMRYRGFLFEISPSNISDSYGLVSYTLEVLLGCPMHQKLPTVRLVSTFPILYHPHFKETPYSTWVEPDRNVNCDNLGSYILRIANSLQYRDGYIFRSSNIANQSAYNWYLKNLHQKERFPSDDLQLPTLKSFKIQALMDPKQPKKFEFETVTTPINSPGKNDQQPTSSIPEPKPRKKFEVTQVTPAYFPVEKPKPSLPIVGELSSDFRNNQYEIRAYSFSKESHVEEASHIFYMTKQAFKDISNHIDWGHHTPTNRVEQGGILLGHTYIDPETKQIFCIAEQSIAGKRAKGSGAYLEMTHETWKEMLDVVDELHSELQIVGWYHTHPNDLGVFMSGTDKATQARIFNNDWQFAIVLNPHKKIWRAFYGAHSKECRGHVIDFSCNEVNNESNVESTPTTVESTPTTSTGEDDKE